MKISVIGAAGTLGSCTTFNLIVNRLAEEIHLIGASPSRLKAHWKDFSQAVIGADTKVTMGGYEGLKGSDIIIITASAPTGAITSRAEFLPGNLPIIKEIAARINQYAPEAIVILETNPVDPLNYGLYLMSKSRDRRKYIGYSLNDTLRFRLWAAEALGASSARVEGMVIGEHGGSQVMLFSSLRLDGKPVELSEETKQKIRGLPAETLSYFENIVPRRTAGWTSAVGTIEIIKAIRNNSKTVIPCNSVLDGEYGASGLSTTVPCVIGKNGIEGIEIVDLAAEEKQGWENSLKILDPYMRQVEEFVGLGSASN